MISLDISPNLICYNTIIDIQRSVRDRSEDSLAMVMTNAQRHFKAMREDWSLSPDHFHLLFSHLYLRFDKKNGFGREVL